MSGQPSNRKRQARAIAISASVEDAQRRAVRRVLAAAAIGTAVFQGAWLIHLALQTAAR